MLENIIFKKIFTVVASTIKPHNIANKNVYNLYRERHKSVVNNINVSFITKAYVEREITFLTGKPPYYTNGNIFPY